MQGTQVFAFSKTWTKKFLHNWLSAHLTCNCIISFQVWKVSKFTWIAQFQPPRWGCSFHTSQTFCLTSLKRPCGKHWYGNIELNTTWFLHSFIEIFIQTFQLFFQKKCCPCSLLRRSKFVLCLLVQSRKVAII